MKPSERLDYREEQLYKEINYWKEEAKYWRERYWAETMESIKHSEAMFGNLLIAMIGKSDEDKSTTER